MTTLRLYDLNGELLAHIEGMEGSHQGVIMEAIDDGKPLYQASHHWKV